MAWDVLIKNGTVISGAGIPPFVADIGVVATRRVRVADEKRELQVSLAIDDMGDLRTSGGLRTIDATGMTVVPAADESLEEGKTVDLPEWRTKTSSTITVGQPARLALLKPAPEPGKFVVHLVLR